MSKHSDDAELWRHSVPDGWHALYDRMIVRLRPIDPDLVVEEAKEKFGELRVYLRSYAPGAHDLIDAASRESRRTCQLCGCPGALRVSQGLFATLCEQHGGGFELVTQEPIVASFSVQNGEVRKINRDPL
jgi:hypothetical protein